MLNTTDLIVRHREHQLRVEHADRFGWLQQSPCDAWRRRHPMTTLKLTARLARYVLTALAATAFGRA